ncbi:MAG: hypothetical protein ACK53Y_21920, partial [bacterium]
MNIPRASNDAHFSFLGSSHFSEYLRSVVCLPFALYMLSSSSFLLSPNIMSASRPSVTLPSDPI